MHQENTTLSSINNKSRELMVFCFDMDENLFFLNDIIFMFDKLLNKEIAISQNEFYEIEKDKERYGYVNGDMVQSYRQFRLGGGYLREQIIKTYKDFINWNEELIWPAWNGFLKAINWNHPLAIVTARGHDVEEFKLAFDDLFTLMKKDKLLKEDVNPYIMFFPCSNKKLNDDFNIDFETSIQKKKSFFFHHFLNETIKEFFSTDKYDTISVWFSDDSICNIMQLMEYVLRNNWNTSDEDYKDLMDIKDANSILKDKPIEYHFYDTHNWKIQKTKFVWKMLDPLKPLK